MYACICTDHVCLGPTLYLSLANVDKCLAAPGRKGGLDAACSCQLVSMLSLTFPTKRRFPRSLETPNWQHDCRLYNLIIICSYALFWKSNQYFFSHVFSAQIMWTLEYRSGNFCCFFFQLEIYIQQECIHQFICGFVFILTLLNLTGMFFTFVERQN